jgi:DNA-binding transcriptional MocR family regulator
VAKHLREAERSYTERRRALLDELERRGIAAFGRSGMNVWVPVPDEDAVAAALAAAGWAVSTGARFRIKSGPAVRITISTLASEKASAVAEALARALRPVGRSLSV